MINTLNILSIFIYILFGYFIFKKNNYWPILFFFYIGQLWAIISSYYIEQGIYITEQNIFSFETGATYRLVLLNLVFFISTLIMLKFLPQRSIIEKSISTMKNEFLLKILVMIILFCSTLYLLDAVTTYIKFGGTYNKFNFKEYSFALNYNFGKYLYSYISLFPLLLGVLFITFKNEKSIRLVIISSMAFILIANVLQGNKFSALYTNLLLFSIPYLTIIKLSFNKKNIKKFFIISTLIISFLIIVLNLSIKEYSVYQSNSALDMILYRTLGLQGHVWWGTDYYSGTLTEVDKEINLSNELDVIQLKSNGRYTSGLNALMLFISPTIGEHFIEMGVSFTMGFPALLITLFDPIELILVMIFLGVVFGIFVYLLNRAITSMDYLNIVFLGFIYIFGIRMFFSMGTTVSIFNKTMYFVVIGYIYINLLSIIIKKRYKIVN